MCVMAEITKFNYFNTLKSHSIFWSHYIIIIISEYSACEDNFISIGNYMLLSIIWV